jgi:hypothetical protein
MNNVINRPKLIVRRVEIFMGTPVYVRKQVSVEIIKTTVKKS